MNKNEERYRYDPEFRRLVDTIYHAYSTQQYTPSEIRDAAMFACIKYEMENQRHIFRQCDVHPELLNQMLKRGKNP